MSSLQEDHYNAALFYQEASFDHELVDETHKKKLRSFSTLLLAEENEQNKPLRDQLFHMWKIYSRSDYTKAQAAERIIKTIDESFSAASGDFNNSTESGDFNNLTESTSLVDLTESTSLVVGSPEWMKRVEDLFEPWASPAERGLNDGTCQLFICLKANVLCLSNGHVTFMSPFRTSCWLYDLHRCLHGRWGGRSFGFFGKG